MANSGAFGTFASTSWEMDIMSEIIVSGFDDAHTAFLARAALARRQQDLELSVYDLAIV